MNEKAFFKLSIHNKFWICNRHVFKTSLEDCRTLTSVHSFLTFGWQVSNSTSMWVHCSVPGLFHLPHPPGRPRCVLWMLPSPFTAVFRPLNPHAVRVPPKHPGSTRPAPGLWTELVLPLSFTTPPQHTRSVFTTWMKTHAPFQLRARKPGCHPGLLPPAFPTTFDWLHFSGSAPVVYEDWASSSSWQLPRCRLSAVLSRISSSVSNWLPYFSQTSLSSQTSVPSPTALRGLRVKRSSDCATSLGSRLPG